MTVKINRFNQLRSIKSELSSETERADKIMEMNKRGFVAVRTYEYERERKDYVATGFYGAKHRYNGSESRLMYGVVFRRLEEVGGNHGKA